MSSETRIERFTKDEFEAALPRHKDTGDTMWTPNGCVSGEYEYFIKVRDGVFVKVRSSVRQDGVAADTGKDSIRAWLVGEDAQPLGAKLLSHTTRLPGWQDRMDKILKELWKRGMSLQNCPSCDKPMGYYKVKKDGENKGRLFTKCWDHNHFSWLDENFKPIAETGKKKQAPKPRLEMEALTEGEMVELIQDIPTKKARIEALRKAIAEDERAALHALMKIYSYQTTDEKDGQATRWQNDLGFSAFDAEILSSFAEQFNRKAWLSEKQMALVHKKMVRYAGQLKKILRQEFEADESYEEAERRWDGGIR